MELIDKTKLRHSIVDFMYAEHSEVGHEREFEVLQAVLRMIDAQPQVMRWIPVTERLPEESDGDYVLVCTTCKVTNKIDYRNAVVMAFVCKEGFVDTELDEVLTGVTHWMPLPDAPEVEE